MILPLSESSHCSSSAAILKESTDSDAGGARRSGGRRGAVHSKEFLESPGDIDRRPHTVWMSVRHTLNPLSHFRITGQRIKKGIRSLRGDSDDRCQSGGLRHE